MKKRNLFVVSVVTAFTMLITACSPAAPVTVVVTAPPVIQTGAPVIQTVQVPVQQTVQVTVPVVATAAATSAPTTVPPTPATSFAGLKDPKDVALAAAGGTKIGGILDFLGVWSGAELASFQAVVAPFQDATGINVEIESTRDVNTVLATRVNGGNPPDAPAAPSASLPASSAAEGKLIDLTPIPHL